MNLILHPLNALLTSKILDLKKFLEKSENFKFPFLKKQKNQKSFVKKIREILKISKI